MLTDVGLVYFTFPPMVGSDFKKRVEVVNLQNVSHPTDRNCLLAQKQAQQHYQHTPVLVTGWSSVPRVTEDQHLEFLASIAYSARF